MIRAAVSLELPAANGTTTVTGRVGQLCADAVSEAATNTAMLARAPSTTRTGLDMIGSPCGCDRPAPTA
jgi:hypothetical protein